MGNLTQNSQTLILGEILPTRALEQREPYPLAASMLLLAINTPNNPFASLGNILLCNVWISLSYTTAMCDWLMTRNGEDKRQVAGNMENKMEEV